MFKVYYKYGAMNSSKTASLLMAAHNYKTKNVSTYLVTPALDTRAGVGVIKARIGLETKADLVLSEFNQQVKDFLKTAYDNDGVIFIDEAQFVKSDVIHKMVDYCHELDFNNLGQKENFNILAYGLLTDFTGHLFDGSKAWLEEATSIAEIKTICYFCNRKATRNLLMQDTSKEKSNIVIGDKAYKSVCAYHYWKYTHDKH